MTKIPVPQVSSLLFLMILRHSVSFSSSCGGSRMRIQIKSFPIKRHHRRPISTATTITMMPEGPEVRTLVDQLQGGVGRRLLDIRFVSGRYVSNGKPNGFAEFAATMTPIAQAGNESVDIIQSWQAKGKFSYILLDQGGKPNPFAGDPALEEDDFQRSIWITLGMTGKIVSEQVHAQNSAHGRWYLELLDVATGKKTKLHYHDTRNFGTLKFCLSKTELENKLESLGADILDPQSTTEEVYLQIVASKRNPEMNICKFLMDQSNLSGVGNYILAEGLYRANVDPFASLREITEEDHRRLFRELQSTALESYAAQGMTRPKGGSYATVDGSKGQFEMQLQCYGRQLCSRGDPVIKETSGPHGRTIWYTEQQLIVPLSERFQSTDSSSNNVGKKTSASSVKLPEPSTAATKVGAGWDNLAATGSDKDKSEFLLSSLVDGGWRNIISEHLDGSESFQQLAGFLDQEIKKGEVVYPPQGDLFSAMNLCPLEKTKVVIVGQDPYHGPGQGHGLAFSVKKGVPPPPSLKNIFKEAIEDVAIEPPTHGNLQHWAKQGVLLLNSVLTVRKGDANSHSGRWEFFTDFIIQHINTQKEGVVFLLWGNPAQKKAAQVDESKHFMIRTSHPSPLGATKTASPFLGSRCFSRCNQILQEQGQDPIDWSVR